ncbi:hypothetical protein BTUL_0174g00030 [Botrytis tulipae]|uniref:Uncharacterized protein n=1 Tax=Botrytis tulipae TaxID=87230 RepID=A0A4Z1ECQ1_9HELO|nr:hypothetical protein BTUL_0174g00030 [Botrytis tulipae]
MYRHRNRYPDLFTRILKNFSDMGNKSGIIEEWYHRPSSIMKLSNTPQIKLLLQVSSHTLGDASDTFSEDSFSYIRKIYNCTYGAR